MLHPRFPPLTSPRNCPTEIILLVWRLVPQVKAAQEGMARRASCKSAFDLQSPPHKREKSGPEQRRSCHILWDSTDGLGLHTWDRYTELGKRGQSTLPALSRVPSASDQNYIILAPLNPGSQVGLAWLWALLAPASVLSSITSKYLLILQATPLSFGGAFTVFLKHFPQDSPQGYGDDVRSVPPAQAHTARHCSHFLLQNYFFPLPEVLWLGWVWHVNFCSWLLSLSLRRAAGDRVPSVPYSC